jgi:hypothetical protein
MYFRSIGIRSNGVRSNGVSVKWCFGQMAFRSNGVRPNGVRSTNFSVKRRSVKKKSVKWFFGEVIQNPFHTFLAIFFGNFIYAKSKIHYGNEFAADELRRRNSYVVDELKNSFFCFESGLTAFCILKFVWKFKDSSFSDKLYQSFRMDKNRSNWIVDIVRHGQLGTSWTSSGVDDLWFWPFFE